MFGYRVPVYDSEFKIRLALDNYGYRNSGNNDDTVAGSSESDALNDKRPRSALYRSKCQCGAAPSPCTKNFAVLSPRFGQLNELTSPIVMLRHIVAFAPAIKLGKVKVSS